MISLCSRLLVLTSCLFLFGFDNHRQQTLTSSLSQSSNEFPCSQWTIPSYKSERIASPLVIDGKLNEAAWQNATKSTAFSDLIKGTPAHLDTRAAVLWDDQYLYVAYWIEEPNVEATLKERDAPIYQNNDVELFIAGKDGYYEFEINGYNTIYEVLFFWRDAYQRGGYSKMPEFNEKDPLAKTFNGVGYKTHPRGLRVGFWSWDFPGLKHAVDIQGTINNNKDLDRGWTVELALPWSGMKILAKGDGRSLPPKPGDVWKMDFSRFNTYKDKSPGSVDSGGWVWSPHGAWDSHIPECFTNVIF
ncbi:carbohydrate-binding family 9-like protein [Chryseolinea sp. T2]|uniref:carbohydrate-binding family 9-like protein n=1 Tax=Chryseolinea sp. T2 TaxID=3129255 RepID=UPI003076CD7C